MKRDTLKMQWKKCYRLQWNPVNMVTNDPGILHRITGVALLTHFSYNKMYGRFAWTKKWCWELDICLTTQCFPVKARAKITHSR